MARLADPFDWSAPPPEDPGSRERPPMAVALTTGPALGPAEEVAMAKTKKPAARRSLFRELMRVLDSEAGVKDAAR